MIDDEKLIELVRDHELLYDSKHPKYMDSHKKESAWKEIALQMQHPPTMCKQRWQCLRDLYRRALKARRKKGGTDRQWKYEAEMSFINAHFVSRKPQEHAEPTSNDESDHQDEDKTQDNDSHDDSSSHCETSGQLDQEKLIKLVHEYEFLYNLRHPKYMDNQRKDNAWKTIGKQLRQPPALCKLKWQNLRDSYRRALKNRKEKTGEAAKNIKPWKYEKEMSFMNSYFMEMKGQDFTEAANCNDEIYFEIDRNPLELEDVQEDENVSYDDYYFDTDEIAESETKKVRKKQLVNKKHSLKNEHKRRLDQEEPSQSKIVTSPTAALMSLHELQETVSTPKKQDELESFFSNMCDTVRKFSRYHQALARKKIFTIVSEMELQQLEPPRTFTFAETAQMKSFELQNPKCEPIADALDD